MKDFKIRTPQELDEAWGNLLLLCDGDKDMADTVIGHVNKMLDEMLGSNLFGTEGQLDPRQSL